MYNFIYIYMYIHVTTIIKEEVMNVGGSWIGRRVGRTAINTVNS